MISSTIAPSGGQYEDQGVLPSSADLGSLHLTVNSQMMYFIDQEKLSIMDAGTFPINSSRWEVVHKYALVEALRSWQIGGEALNIFENAPPTSMARIKIQNVVSAHHIGMYTDKTLRSWDEICGRH